MNFYNNKLHFSPTDLVRFFESEFASYMDHFEKVVPLNIRLENNISRNPIPPFLSTITKMGIEHEKQMIQKIEKDKKVIRINTDELNRKQALTQTHKAIKRGEDNIYQAAIQKDNIFGYVDLLVKVKNPSTLGNYSYIPYDFKVSSVPKASSIIQLCCYCDILQSVQKTLPDTFVIITRDGLYHIFKTNKFFAFYQFLKKHFVDFHNQFSKNNMPIPHKTEQHRDWSSFAQKKLQQLDDISLIAEISTSYTQILRQANITKMSELPKQTNLNLQGISQVSLEHLKEQARLQIASIQEAIPKFTVLPPIKIPIKTPIKIGQGLALLPPEQKQDIFFNPKYYFLLGNTGLNYLYGSLLNKTYNPFWAYSKSQEATVFNKWLNWIYSNYKKNKNIHIYHYKNHTITTLKKLIKQHNEAEDKLEELLNKKVFVDLHKILIQSLIVGSTSYSLSKIEPLYYKKRSSDITSEDQAMNAFFMFLDSKKAGLHSPYLKQIQNYNHEDCLSLQQLYGFLKKIQKKHNIKYLQTQSEEDQYNKSEVIQQCKQKSEEFLKSVCLSKKNLPPLNKTQNKEEYIKILFAHLLKFHIKENIESIKDCSADLNMSSTELIQKPKVVVSGFYKNNIFNSLLKTAQDLSFSAPYMGLNKCLYDLLLKNSSSISHLSHNHNFNQTPLLKEAYHNIANLKNSVFCIQGPPGAGKTYIAAFIILKLIQDKKKIGIMANSHKAITQVLKKISCFKINHRNFIYQKVTNTDNYLEDKNILKNSSIELVMSHQVNPLAQVVGGTPFFFSKPNQEGMYDYLFIDEASQVSLANMAAASRATKNIILIGDQNQLTHTIKASHPGESGNNVLSYYTNNTSVILKNKGLFLPFSYRMHPQICQFISEQFYDKKLYPHPDTTQQEIIFPKNLKYLEPYIPSSGLYFIPVKHKNNTHSSIEEAQVICKIYKKLIQSQWINQKGETTSLTPKDILIIAPYNFQVTCLKKELNDKDILIASVDKFQGQEAVISILSLAASTIENAPRKIDFLLKKNRLNVALSRARCLSIIVGSADLISTRISSISSIENMELMNTWCKIVQKKH